MSDLRLRVDKHPSTSLVPNSVLLQEKYLNYKTKSNLDRGLRQLTDLHIFLKVGGVKYVFLICAICFFDIVSSECF